MKMQVTIEIPEQVGADILTTAWEGGIDYWCGAYDPKAERRGGEPNQYANELDVISITFQTPGGDEEFNEPIKVTTIGVEEIIQAIGTLLNKPELAPGTARVLQEGMEDMAAAADAGDADNLVQIAAFGEVIYG